MNKALLLSLWCVILLLIAFPLHAQTGCTDSPENPTVVLALVGSAGGLFSMARRRWKTRHGSSARSCKVHSAR
jgi:XrtJ-associated TM-motif-TM protein